MATSARARPQTRSTPRRGLGLGLIRGGCDVFGSEPSPCARGWTVPSLANPESPQLLHLAVCHSEVHTSSIQSAIEEKFNHQQQKPGPAHLFSCSESYAIFTALSIACHSGPRRASAGFRYSDQWQWREQLCTRNRLVSTKRSHWHRRCEDVTSHFKINCADFINSYSKIKHDLDQVSA